MHALLDKSDLVSAPIQEGDCGIVLKPDGTFQVFSTGVKSSGLTPEQMEQGNKLVCMIVALKTPQIMHMLAELANDPAVKGAGVNLGALN